MAAGRSALVWILLLVGVGAGGIYLADRLVLAPGRQMERALADRDAQIRVLREHAQALEAAIRLLRHTERRARLDVLDQAPGPDGHLLTRLRFSEIDSRGEPIGEAREISVSGDKVYVDTLADNPAEAQRRGVRALHGEAVSTKLRKGRTYAVTFRSTGELTI